MSWNSGAHYTCMNIILYKIKDQDQDQGNYLDIYGFKDRNVDTSTISEYEHLLCVDTQKMR